MSLRQLTSGMASTSATVWVTVLVTTRPCTNVSWSALTATDPSPRRIHQGLLLQAWARDEHRARVLPRGPLGHAHRVGVHLQGCRGELIDCSRIANSQTKYEYNGPNWLSFEPVTRVPICTDLIDWSLMTKDEQRWVNAHNTMVQEALLPLLEDDLDKEARDWLKRVCKPKIIWPW